MFDHSSYFGEPTGTDDDPLSSVDAPGLDELFVHSGGEYPRWLEMAVDALASEVGRLRTDVSVLKQDGCGGLAGSVERVDRSQITIEQFLGSGPNREGSS